MSDAGPRPIAVCRTYDDLLRTLRARRQTLGLTHEQLGTDAGLTDGHAAHLLSPRKGQRSRNFRRFGSATLGPVLEVLGLELVVQERADALVRTEQQNHASADASETKAAPQDWRRNHGPRWGRWMAARRTLLLTAEERSESARTAAQVRWATAKQS